ncbi:hypothetical protein BKA70DRAFT_1398619 [Coprinopsis sp. MPI-PUGE-AT-0042]|nr:hypothetical protein BKA70DRAFT_1398619 [Coprinopsis sp. MPI-PUGE-AT-0042]
MLLKLILLQIFLALFLEASAQCLYEPPQCYYDTSGNLVSGGNPACIGTAVDVCPIRRALAKARALPWAPHPPSPGAFAEKPRTMKPSLSEPGRVSAVSHLHFILRLAHSFLMDRKHVSIHRWLTNTRIVIVDLVAITRVPLLHAGHFPFNTVFQVPRFSTLGTHASVWLGMFCLSVSVMIIAPNPRYQLDSAS